MRSLRLTDDDVLEAIVRLTEDYGFPPTIRELKDDLLVASPSDMHRYLERLREKGMVSWVDGKVRTLTVTKAGLAQLAA